MNMLIIPDQRREEKMTFGPQHIVALSKSQERALCAFADQLTVVLPDLPS